MTRKIVPPTSLEYVVFFILLIIGLVTLFPIKEVLYQLFLYAVFLGAISFIAIISKSN